MRFRNFAAIVTGFTLLAPAAWAHSRSGSDLSRLAPLMGSYRLVDHRYGDCAPTVFIGMGRDSRSIRAGSYNFYGVDLGRMRIDNGNWRGWIKTSLGRRQVETKSYRKSYVDGTKIREETEIELRRGMVQLEHRKSIRSHRNHQRIHNKCLYVKMYEGAEEFPDQGEQDKGQQDKGQQDKGDQGQGDEGQGDEIGK